MPVAVSRKHQVLARHLLQHPQLQANRTTLPFLVTDDPEHHAPEVPVHVERSGLGWDCQAVRNTVRLISTIDCMLQKFDLCNKEPELQCGDHLLKYLSKLLSRYRGWAEARWNLVAQIPRRETSPRQGQNGGCETGGTG